MRGAIVRVGAVALALVAAVTVGGAFHDAAPALDRLPGWAGGRPDVVACERAIAATLPDPASYRRQTIERVDSEPLSQTDFDRQAGIEPIAPQARPVRDGLDATLAAGERIAAMQQQLDRDRAAGHVLRLRSVQIEYRASGAPQKLAICQFRLIDGALEPAATLLDRADRLRRQAALNGALLQLGRGPVGPRRRAVPCCL